MDIDVRVDGKVEQEEIEKREKYCKRQVTVLTEFIDKFANKFARKTRVTRRAYKCVKKVQNKKNIT